MKPIKLPGPSSRSPKPKQIPYTLPFELTLHAAYSVQMNCGAYMWKGGQSKQLTGAMEGGWTAYLDWLLPANPPLLQRDLFFLLNMLWSRHVKPSSAKGEKRLKRIKNSKVCTNWALPESASCTSLRIAVQTWKVELPLQRNTTLRKNLPETLNAVFSPSRSARRAPQGNSIWFDHCRHWGGVAIVALVCNLFFFGGPQGQRQTT